MAYENCAFFSKRRPSLCSAQQRLDSATFKIIYLNCCLRLASDSCFPSAGFKSASEPGPGHHGSSGRGGRPANAGAAVGGGVLSSVAQLAEQRHATTSRLSSNIRPTSGTPARASCRGQWPEQLRCLPVLSGVVRCSCSTCAHSAPAAGTQWWPPGYSRPSRRANALRDGLTASESGVAPG